MKGGKRGAGQPWTREEEWRGRRRRPAVSRHASGALLPPSADAAQSRRPRRPRRGRREAVRGRGGDPAASACAPRQGSAGAGGGGVGRRGPPFQSVSSLGRPLPHARASPSSPSPTAEPFWARQRAEREQALKGGVAPAPAASATGAGGRPAPRRARAEAAEFRAPANDELPLRAAAAAAARAAAVEAEAALTARAGGAARGAAQFGAERRAPPPPQPPPPADDASPLFVEDAAVRDALAADILRHATVAAAVDEGGEAGDAAAADATPKKAPLKPRAKKAAAADAAAEATSTSSSSTTTTTGSDDGDAGDEPRALRLTPAELAALAADPPGDPAPPYIHVVTDARDAERVASILTSSLCRGRVFACDTEVAGIDIAKESPCGHGAVISFTIYCGDDVHFGAQGLQEGEAPVNQLFVDTLLGGDADAAAPIFAAFKPFFEDATILKAWHNYSFDRHVLGNAGIDVKGFAGDTMHMARLFDSSRGRVRGKGYSLESLSNDAEILLGSAAAAAESRGGGAARARGRPAAGAPASAEPSGDDSMTRSKTSMKALFGEPNKKKDGSDGKLVVVPPVDALQTSPSTRGKWIRYAALDAKATHDLRDALEARLRSMRVDADRALADATPVGAPTYTMWNLYVDYWRPFGELLTDMEAAGVYVDRDHLAAAQTRAEADREAAKAAFRAWAASRVDGAEFMNVTSGPQVRQLLFAGAPSGGATGGAADSGGVPLARVFKVPNTTGFIEEGKAKPLKNREITLHGVWGPDARSPLEPAVRTPSGAPAVSTPVLRALAGKPGAAKRALDERRGLAAGVVDDAPDLAAVLADGGDSDADAPAAAAVAAAPALHAEAKALGVGPLYAACGGGEAGLAACAAVDALVEGAAIDTLLSNFIVPLQGDAIATRDPATGRLDRVHCSLNINTETGRLSARRPNLQNQPALEKDRYRVRRAFTADVASGKTLVVADYGQLELRLLAHMAGCESMLAAFAAGGDFHSRTALSMYDYIRADVDAGRVVLETGDGGGGGGVPLLKDVYASERRKAKVLNFSIAYGKTAHGLARDFGTGLDEAEATVARWYEARPEVRDWQARMRAEAMDKGYVRTLLGRRRRLPDAARGAGAAPAARGHALRAAINTPIQGSAADVATAAMVQIGADPELAAMGWTLLLQVHDEVILEGPRGCVDAALARVVRLMERPFCHVNPLRVELMVDAKHADSWYEAK